ncbi:MAG: hypothetical protein AAF264_00205 [Pseudomonadota bacterium]
MTIKITEASASQLAAYAASYHGLSIDHRKGKDAIIAALRTANFEGDEIEADDEDGAASTTAKAKPAGGSEGLNDIVGVYISPQDDEDGGDEPVFVSCDGRAILIPRGKNCGVPRKYVNVLQDAVKVTYSRVKGMGLVARRTPQYPFQILAPGTDLEVTPKTKAV